MADLSDYIEDRTLFTIVLPGTHDSGTSTIDASAKVAPEEAQDAGLKTTVAEMESTCGSTILDCNWFESWNDVPCDLICTVPGAFYPYFGAPWARNQSRTVGEQLNDGIRYLDLRFVKDPDDQITYIHHSLLGPNLETVIGQINDFVSAPGHEKEIIILHLSHIYPGDDAYYAWLANTFFASFGPLMIPPTDAEKTLGELWAASDHRRVVIIAEGMGDLLGVPEPNRSYFWETVYSIDPCAYNLDELYDSLTGFLELRTVYTGTFVIQGIFAFDVPQVEAGIACRLTPLAPGCEGVPQSVEDLAEIATPQVTKWIDLLDAGCAFQAHRNLNVVMVDFYEKTSGGRPGVVEIAIQLNSRLRAEQVPPVLEAQVSPDLTVGGWYTTLPLTVTLTRADDGDCASQIEYLLYNVNGGNWQDYTAPIILMQEDWYEVQFQAIDHAGNKTILELIIPVDTTPPAGSFAINREMLTTSHALVDLTHAPFDMLSGPYLFRGRDAGGMWSGWTPYWTANFWQLPNPSTGQVYIVEGQYMDYAGNAAAVISDTVQFSPQVSQPGSAGYWLQRDTLGSLATILASSNYSIQGTVGQESIIGCLSSPNYQLQSGFWVDAARKYDFYLPVIFLQE